MIMSITLNNVYTNSIYTCEKIGLKFMRGKSIEVKYKYIKIVRRNGISKFVWEKGQFYK